VQSGTGAPGISSGIRVRAQASPNGGQSIYVIDEVGRDKASFDALGPPMKLSQGFEFKFREVQTGEPVVSKCTVNNPFDKHPCGIISLLYQ
jgi:hypothetical protein